MLCSNVFSFAEINARTNVLKGICHVLVSKPGALPLLSVLEYGQKFLLKSNQSADCLESRYALLVLLGASLPQNLSADKSLEVLQLALSLIGGQKVSKLKPRNKTILTRTIYSVMKCIIYCSFHRFLLALRKITSLRHLCFNAFCTVRKV